MDKMSAQLNDGFAQIILVRSFIQRFLFVNDKTKASELMRKIASSRVKICSGVSYSMRTTG